MPAIKILHVIDIEKESFYINNLCAYSDIEEVEHCFVTFASSDSEFVRELIKKKKEVYALNVKTRKDYPATYQNLSKIMKQVDPDIVHTHLFDPSVMGINLAKRQGRKSVVTRHHSDALHLLRSILKRKFYLRLENYISSRADHIIAPSQMVREYLVDIEGVNSEKVSIIPYGQTTERFDAVTIENIQSVRQELSMDNTLSLVNISRLFDRKGHIFLFEAFAKLLKEGVNSTLYLVGAGDYKITLENMCVDMGIVDRVKFLGWRSDVLAIIGASDIIVHPSLEDALSQAVIESIMMEKPIVATDISGIKDTLGNGKYGKVVKPSDADDFYLGLKEVISQIEKYKLIAKEGKKYILKYMDARHVADQHTQIYNRVVLNK